MSLELSEFQPKYRAVLQHFVSAGTAAFELYNLTDPADTANKRQMQEGIQGYANLALQNIMPKSYTKPVPSVKVADLESDLPEDFKAAKFWLFVKLVGELRGLLKSQSQEQNKDLVIPKKKIDTDFYQASGNDTIVDIKSTDDAHGHDDFLKHILMQLEALGIEIVETVDDHTKAIAALNNEYVARAVEIYHRHGIDLDNNERKLLVSSHQPTEQRKDTRFVDIYTPELTKDPAIAEATKNNTPVQHENRETQPSSTNDLVAQSIIRTQRFIRQDDANRFLPSESDSAQRRQEIIGNAVNLFKATYLLDLEFEKRRSAVHARYNSEATRITGTLDGMTRSYFDKPGLREAQIKEIFRMITVAKNTLSLKPVSDFDNGMSNVITNRPVLGLRS